MTCKHEVLKRVIVAGKEFYTCAAKCGAPLFNAKPIEIVVTRGRKV